MNPLIGLPEHVPILARLSDYVDSGAGDAAADGERRLDYDALRERVGATAAWLASLGVLPGDRVAMWTAPSIDFWLVFLATVRLGGVWTGLNPKHTFDELARTIPAARPRLIVARHASPLTTEALACTGVAVVAMQDAAPATPPSDVSDPDAPSLLVFTSGSSGTPKGVLITQRALIAGARGRAAAWWHGPMRALVNLPVSHIGAVGDVCVTTLSTGGMVIFQDRFDAAGGLGLIARERLTFLYQVPTQLQMVLAAPNADSADLSTLRAVVWSGGPAPVSLVEALQVRFPGRLGTDYSGTETVGAVTLAPLGTPSRDLADAAGWPNPARDVRLAESGEVLVRGAIFSGYLDQSESSAVDADGWLHTGDVGHWRDDGALILDGRTSEIFKSGGYNIHPREIELALEAIPGVKRAAVVAVKHPIWGEIGHAFVEGPGLESMTLMETLRAQLANYKIPKSLSVLTALPLLPIGKTDKAALREKVLLVGEIECWSTTEAGTYNDRRERQRQS